MSAQPDKLHLWFKPHNGMLDAVDLKFLENYGRRFYPKSMARLASAMHKLCSYVSKLCPEGSFEYQMTHMTKGSNERYTIEESLREVHGEDGLSFGIQATTPDEKAVFADCMNREDTQSVQNVIAYLEDSFQTEHTKWEGIRLQNGAEALPVIKEIVEFLKAMRSVVRVHSFELNQTDKGMQLTLVLLAPGVLTYYTRFDWNIV